MSAPPRVAVAAGRSARHAGTRRSWRPDPIAILALPAAIYMTVVFAAPLGMLLVESFRVEQQLTLANYGHVVGDRYGRLVVWNSVKLATLTTIFALVIGYPMAFVMARSRAGLQTVLLAVVFLPLSVSVIVKAFGWTILLRSDGIVNQMLMMLGITSEPLRLIFTEKGLLIGIVNMLLPFMVLPVYSVIAMIKPELEDAAACLGAGPVYRFFHVVLPLSMPGVIVGVALVFSQAVSAYVIPTLLAGERYRTMSMDIAKHYLFFGNEEIGSVLGVLLLVIAGIVVAASGLLTRERREAR